MENNLTAVVTTRVNFRLRGQGFAILRDYILEAVKD